MQNFKSTPRRPNRQQMAGFSLIELSIVLIVSGLIFSSGMSVYRINLHSKVIDDTHANMVYLRTALDDFYKNKGRYPCPAYPARHSKTEPVGKEICAEDLYDCKKGLCLSETVNTDSDAAPAKILEGVVPYATLGLNQRQVLDGWGRQFAYIVSEPLIAPESFREEGAAIFLRKADGETPVRKNKDREVKFQALILSHGQNGKGGYTSSGVMYLPCTGDGVDIENCNHDPYFISDQLSHGDNDSYFDDIITIQLKSTFDLATSSKDMCPDGQFVYGVNPAGQILCRAP